MKYEDVVAWRKDGSWFVTTVSVDEDGGFHLDKDLIEDCGDNFVTGCQSLVNVTKPDALIALGRSLMDRNCGLPQIESVSRILTRMKEMLADLPEFEGSEVGLKARMMQMVIKESM